MKSLLAILTLLFLLITATSLEAQTVTPVWAVDGWTVTVKLTNPNPLSTAAPYVVALDSVYDIDGVVITNAVESISLPAPAVSTAKKTYTSKTSITNLFTIVNPTGTGGASFDASGKLVYFVTAVNDGVEHTFSFKLKPKIPGWLMVYTSVKDNLYKTLIKSLG